MDWTKHFVFYTEYVFYKIIWTLKLLENQTIMSNQVVSQIWKKSSLLKGFKVPFHGKAMSNFKLWMFKLLDDT